MKLSVILPTHNPNRQRLARTLEALRGQSLPMTEWELLVVNNASSPAITTSDFFCPAPANIRIVHEPNLGLTYARRRGFLETRGRLIILVDDDNVLGAKYLSEVIRLFGEHPDLGAAGGPVRPEFESPPPTWAEEFYPLLALRDLGPHSLIAGATQDPRTGLLQYPTCAPIGAGMALRRAALASWIQSTTTSILPDRQGTALTSGGDNDIVFSILRAGWKVGYFPTLTVTHIIPDSRLDTTYLARLNEGIQHSWIQVLAHHQACPWPPIPRWSVPLRCAKAWLTHRAWTGPASTIRWRGACGHFAGRAAIDPKT